MSDFYDYQNQAEFNQGLAQIYRMDAWAKLSAQSMIMDDHEQRYKALLLFFNECYGTDSKTKRKKLMYTLQQDVEGLMRAWRNINKQPKQAIHYKQHPNHFLQHWEMMLREWAQMLGLGMKKSSDGTFALME